MTQIKAISVYQTAKVVAAMYFILSAVVAVPLAIVFAVMGHMQGAVGFNPWTFVLAPVLYGVVGFIAVASGAWIYNRIAGRLGGIEIELG